MEETSDEDDDDDDCNENGEVISRSPSKFRCDFFRGKNLAYKISKSTRRFNFLRSSLSVFNIALSSCSS